MKQIRGRRLRALGQDNRILEAARLVVLAFLGHAGLSGDRTDDIVQFRRLQPGLALVGRMRLQEDISSNDLANRQIAVVHGLRDIVAVGGFAEIGDIVGGDGGVFERPTLQLDVLGQIERARGRGEADL